MRDVLVLTHREDLLGQLRDHVQRLQHRRAAPHIRLRELREYPEVKAGASVAVEPPGTHRLLLIAPTT